MHSIGSIVSLDTKLSSLVRRCPVTWLTGLAMRSATIFFDSLSRPGDVENVKHLVTPRLYDYLKCEFNQAGDLRPVYEIGPDPISLGYINPFVLSGPPQIYQYGDDYQFNYRPTDVRSAPFDVYKTQNQLSALPEEYKYASITRWRNVGIAAGWPFVVDPEIEGFRYIWRMWNWVWSRGEEKIKDQTLFDQMTLAASRWALFEKSTKGHFLFDYDDSLGYIIDVIISLPIKMTVVRRDNGRDVETVSTSSSNKQTVVLTLRSNHVTPGWKFNRESVRWYIDDINLTVRRIPGSQRYS